MKIKKLDVSHASDDIALGLQPPTLTPAPHTHTEYNTDVKHFRISFLQITVIAHQHNGSFGAHENRKLLLTGAFILTAD